MALGYENHGLTESQLCFNVMCYCYCNVQLHYCVLWSEIYITRFICCLAFVAVGYDN